MTIPITGTGLHGRQGSTDLIGFSKNHLGRADHASSPQDERKRKKCYLKWNAYNGVDYEKTWAKDDRVISGILVQIEVGFTLMLQHRSPIGSNRSLN